MTTVPTCVECGASTGTEFPIWPQSGRPFGSICAPCDTPSCVCDPCQSALAGQVPDMHFGDTCIMCLCRECERCGATIDIDEEHRVVEPHGGGFGYIDVCDKCIRDTDRLETTMDMRDQQVQDLLEQDKQEALARIRAQQ